MLLWTWFKTDEQLKPPTRWADRLPAPRQWDENKVQLMWTGPEHICDAKNSIHGFIQLEENTVCVGGDICAIEEGQHESHSPGHDAHLPDCVATRSISSNWGITHTHDAWGMSMPPGMLAQVLWEALAEAGWDAGLARSMTALESTSASCCKVPDTDYSQNRTERMTNAIRNRNLSINVLPAEKWNALLSLCQMENMWKNEQTETGSLIPSSEVLLAMAFCNKVLYQCYWRARPPPSQNLIKWNSCSGKLISRRYYWKRSGNTWELYSNYSCQRTKTDPNSY